MMRRRVHFYRLSLFVFFGLLVSLYAKAETAEAQGRIVYERRFDDRTELVMFGTDMRTSIPLNHCYDLSPELKLAAVLDYDNPGTLYLRSHFRCLNYRIFSEQTDALSCTPFWIDEQRLGFIHSVEPYRIYEFALA